MEDQPETCKNCEKTFDESFEFCPYCGQKSKDELTLGVLFYNTISNYFSFDARFFKSFIPLMFKPGVLAKRFIEGKRLLYLHPAQMYLFISVVFFFLLSVTVVRDQVKDLDANLKRTLVKPLISDSTKVRAQAAIDSLELDSILQPLRQKGIPGVNTADVRALDSIIKLNVKKTDGNDISFDFNEKKVDSLIAINATDDEILKGMGMHAEAGRFKRKLYTQALKFYKQRNGGQILKAVYDTIPIALFVLLPIFALILKLLFYRRGLYAHHLVFSFYFFSFLFTVFSIILVFNNFWEVPDWIDWLIVVSTFIYLFIAIKHFYQQGWFVSFFKTSVATIFYMSFVIPIAVIIVGFISFLYY
ncbi:DUF3667 domain-containing protein [Changchengzhania lutea]|uniref:DUF3667 domain-containing protein n=1 Tax=Changchengzhania lutea TaxID=2049305 RepID=UPI00115E7850|nr:DUF3667 domain-containing protein [Changchengzhania lutea]